MRGSVWLLGSGRNVVEEKKTNTFKRLLDDFIESFIRMKTQSCKKRQRRLYTELSQSQQQNAYQKGVKKKKSMAANPVPVPSRV